MGGADGTEREGARGHNNKETRWRKTITTRKKKEDKNEKRRKKHTRK